MEHNAGVGVELVEQEIVYGMEHFDDVDDWVE